MPDLIIRLDDGLDLAALDRQLDALAHRMERAAVAGVGAGMAELEASAKATDAYRGQSGATRASTVGYAAHAGDDGHAAFAAAYATAAEHLEGFSGHRGRPARMDAGTVDPDEIAGILTVPTDYIDKLETTLAGAKAVLGPTMAAGASVVTQAVAAASRQELGS